MSDPIVLTNFQPLLPPYEIKQEVAGRWLAEAHTQAEATKLRASGQAVDTIREKMRTLVDRYGCNVGQILTRRHELSDFQHTNWPEMKIFRLLDRPEGLGLEARMRFFRERVSDLFERWYPADSAPPDDLIHVSCTGYVSPSAAQEVVAQNGWGERTTVTHAYHMGCYGTIPALRIARGFLQSGRGRADIAHTELCTLHLNPSLHTPDQFVVQSLFADGHIRYSLERKIENAANPSPSFVLLAVREELLPDSTDAMTWLCSDWGFTMTLSRDVPILTARAIEHFLERLFAEAEMDFQKKRDRILIALHPGGPAILDRVLDTLRLREDQIAHSRSVLRSYGNMSSATLPYIWRQMAEDPAVLAGSLIASVTFGPGLTAGGCLLEKR
ncbi:MAG TPA: 3-oxoacyl-[acyl-carrier-protein] synthase III C-terminal domain-containing protein [Bdellovibrionota bacterium]|nr:3-oxoacyl-[acyl-carrier-protein] synthase III C-terminal domain-containing protein [Bdellovibrionota bacterium]